MSKKRHTAEQTVPKQVGNSRFETEVYPTASRPPLRA